MDYQIKTKELLAERNTKENNLVLIVIENYNQGLNKSLSEMMLEAGYQASELEQYNPILKQVNENIYFQEFISDLDKKKRLALSFLTAEKLQVTSSRDLSQIVDTLNKNEQLLRGNATYRVDVNKNILNDQRYKTILREAIEDCAAGDPEEPDEFLLGHGQEVSSELASSSDWPKADGSNQESEE